MVSWQREHKILEKVVACSAQPASCGMLVRI